MILPSFVLVLMFHHFILIVSKPLAMLPYARLCSDWRLEEINYTGLCLSSHWCKIEENIKYN